MIKKLTAKQKEMLPIYRDKWLKIGLSTEPTNRNKAEEYLNQAYEIVGLEKPKQIIWAESPLSSVILIHILKNNYLGDSVRASVRASAMTSVWDSVWDSIWASFGDSVWDSLYYECIFGSHDAAYLGLYNYFLEVLKIESCNKLIPLMDLSKEVGWFFPYKDVCVISEKPIKINLKNGRIHCEDDPSILYKDGFSVYGLNGIIVTKEIVETPHDKLDAKLILNEKNVEVRREIIRKIGMERICKDLDTKILDKKTYDIGGYYELISINIGDDRIRPYLRMTNQSTGSIHIEGVPPEIKTVDNALAWRTYQNGKYQPPYVMT